MDKVILDYITKGGMDLLNNPAIQGYLINVLYMMLAAFGSKVDHDPRTEKTKPYLEAGVLILTAVLAILKAVVAGDAQHAPWDQLVNLVLFFIGAKVNLGKPVIRRTVHGVRSATFKALGIR